MKVFCLLGLAVCLSLGSMAQSSQLDSLQQARSDFVARQKAMQDSIDQVDSLIIGHIWEHGHPFALKSYYRGQEFTVRKDRGYHADTLASYSAGDTVLIVGMDGIYHQVRVGDSLGLLYLSDPPKTFPFNLLDHHSWSQSRTKSSTESSGGAKSYKSSSHRSSSVQCSGYTQSGRRCRNRTTSASGRCHYH